MFLRSFEWLEHLNPDGYIRGGSLEMGDDLGLYTYIAINYMGLMELPSGNDCYIAIENGR